MALSAVNSQLIIDVILGLSLAPLDTAIDPFPDGTGDKAIIGKGDF